MRPRALLSRLPLLLVFVFIALAPAARAVEMQVEGLQDSLLGPPQDFNINHCTLRKAINNANDNAAF